MQSFMMYEHEKRERADDRDIIRLPMPKPNPELAPMMLWYLHDRELSYELARSNGWYPTMHKGPRVVMPCINSAVFHYWQARAMSDNEPRYDSPPIPRKDSIMLLFPRNYSNNHPGYGKVVITEGPMKSLAAAEFYPSIATMGLAPSDEVLRFIKHTVEHLGLKEVLVVPDNDPGALEFIDYFLDMTPKVLIPTRKDLDQMPRWEREKLLA